MKKIALVISIFLMFGAIQAQKIKQFPLNSIVYDLNGNPIMMGDILKNDDVPVIVDFWATWCRPCLGAINNTHKKYPTWKKEDGVKMVLISIDREDKIEAIKAMAEKKGWIYELYIDKEKAIQKRMGITQIPNTFLINEAGEVLHHEVGYVTGDENVLIKKIRKYKTNKEKK